MANKKQTSNEKDEKDPSDEEEAFSSEGTLIDPSIVEDTFADEDYSDFNDVDNL